MLLYYDDKLEDFILDFEGQTMNIKTPLPMFGEVKDGGLRATMIIKNCKHINERPLYLCEKIGG